MPSACTKRPSSLHASNEFVQNEALANELAARFYASRGFEKIAKAYLRDARDGYRQWGAEGKVRQLQAHIPISRRNIGFPIRRGPC